MHWKLIECLWEWLQAVLSQQDASSTIVEISGSLWTPSICSNWLCLFLCCIFLSIHVDALLVGQQRGQLTCIHCVAMKERQLPTPSHLKHDFLPNHWNIQRHSKTNSKTPCKQPIPKIPLIFLHHLSFWIFFPYRRWWKPPSFLWVALCYPSWTCHELLVEAKLQGGR